MARRIVLPVEATRLAVPARIALTVPPCASNRPDERSVPLLIVPPLITTPPFCVCVVPPRSSVPPLICVAPLDAPSVAAPVIASVPALTTVPPNGLVQSRRQRGGGAKR